MKPINPNISKKAADLLQELYDTAGHKIITGQHTQTNPMEEISYIKELTGREPKLRGFEMLAYSPNINYEDAGRECMTEVEENKHTMKTAISWAKKTDGIVTLTFHWFSPIGGRDKSFYAEHTDFDARRILQENTKERAAFFHDMDAIADVLKEFEREDIPILWRPFHEADGTWFWWGAHGPAVAAELYKLMYTHFTEIHKINNLLWVWNACSPDAYPGDQYVDVISIDVYLEEYRATDYAEQYRQLVSGTSRQKVAALAEVGYLPDIRLLEKSRIPWAYFMTWSKEFILGEQYNTKERVKEMYQSDYAVTAGK